MTTLSHILKLSHAKQPISRFALCCLIGVYGFWLISQGPSNALSNFIEQISIAITMVFGSLIAGGTALGGGAVAFPVMTKMLNIEPATAKVFSLAIQSFGMTAASIIIITQRITFYRNFAWLALCGALPGVLISLTWIADIIPRLVTKSLFSAFLIVFAVTLLNLKKKHHASGQEHHLFLVVIIGFIGGLVAGLIGSGADIALFALLMLYYKKDIKAATATSVVVMACTSVVASLYNWLFLDAISDDISNYVFAAMPVVVIGAPLGAYFCSIIKEQTLLTCLLLLILLEVSFTAYELYPVI